MKLLESIVESYPEIIEIRRDLHAHPEFGFEEVRTSKVVAAKLAERDTPTIRGLGGTGVIGIVKSGASDRAIGLRADMGALPMQEQSSFLHRPYK